MNKPTKYRGNYSDAMIKNSIEALRLAQTANSIFMASKMPEADYRLRRECLQKARGLVENIATISHIFLERIRRIDKEEAEKINKQKKYIGTICSEIHKKIAGVIKSDAAIYKK